MDANALLNIAKELGKDSVEVLEGECTLTLASYEAGNGMWKECNLLDELSYGDASEILDFTGSMMERMEVLSPRNLGLMKKTLENALREEITYYDSAYLTLAEERGYTLVTDDGKLRKVASRKDIKAIPSERMIEDAF